MPPEDSHSPRMLGRYALYEKIASGGMASVHLGRLVGPVGFARTVAIKRMHPQFAEDPEFVSMFLDEARLAARIRHPNVVPTLDVVATEGELFLVMDFVQGESLARLVRMATLSGERIPPPMVATILVGVLHGLHAAHEATSDRGEPMHVVHRDVSPQNVLVGVDGVSRVLDFGVAKAAGRLQSTREGQLKGKLAYMAPEQLRGIATRATDVYAASVVLWEALTGRRLFQGENEGHVFGQVQSGCTEPPSMYAPGIPPEIDAVTMRGLAVDPESRFSTAREMACALEDAVPLAPASRIGAWVERAAKDTLGQRSARIASIESDSSMYPTVDAPAHRSSHAAPRPATMITAAPPVAASDTLVTQLSSGSMSSPGRPLRLADRPRALLGVASSVFVLGLVAVAKVITAPGSAVGIAGQAPPLPSGSATELTVAPEVPAPAPVVAVEVAAVASAATPPPNVEASATASAPPGSAEPHPSATPATPARAPTAPAARPTNTCNPPYSINAVGHRVRKPECH